MTAVAEGEARKGSIWNRKRLLLSAVAVLVLAIAAYVLLRPSSTVLVLTGIVTTDDVIVGPQVTGQVERLLVKEGDSVTANQLLAVIAPAELEADRAYYAHTAAGVASSVQQSEAELRYQEDQTEAQIRQAEAMVAATQAQQAEAVASLEDARLTRERLEPLAAQGGAAVLDLDHARTTYDAAVARVEALARQVAAQQAGLSLARSSAEQIAVRRSALVGSRQQQAAADAQRTKAQVRLGYTELHAPINGVVDVRAVRLGEIVNPGQPVVTLIDPDDLWVRADVEESYIERVRLGDHLTVRLPSGETRSGTVFFRGVDASFATQRDVSRTKRDIRTFEVRLRVPNTDRRLAVGMTAYVLLPVPR